MTNRHTAVLDRVVDGETAVLLVESADRVVDELTVDLETIPKPGRVDGAVFTILVDDGELTHVEFRPQETKSRRDAAQNRFDRLSEDLGDADR